MYVSIAFKNFSVPRDNYVFLIFVGEYKDAVCQGVSRINGVKENEAEVYVSA